MVRKQLSVASRQLSVKTAVWLSLLLLATGHWQPATALPQQPQTSDVSNTPPLFSANAKYANGVAPGYWPTKGGGLTLNLSAGTAVCGSPPLSAYYSGGTLSLPANKTNYIYIMSAGLGLQPTTVTATPSGTGGSLAAGSYQVSVTYVNPSGETLWANEATVTTSGTTSKITVTSPAAYLNATGYNVYVSAVNGASGSETKQNSPPVGLGTNYGVTSVSNGSALPEIADTTACAPWYTNTVNANLGYSGFPQGQRPIAVVTTGASAITAIIDVRTWFDATSAMDSGNQVFNVMAYGAVGDGMADDTAAIQAAINAAMDWLGGVIYFPGGTYRITSGLTWKIAALEFRGAGIASILEIEHAGDAITVPASSSGFKMEDLQIWVNYPSGSRGTNAVIANSASNGFVRNVLVQSVTTANAGVFYRCTTAGADGWLFDTVVFIGGASTLWQDYFLLQNSSSSQTLASYFWTNIVGGTGLADAGWDLNGTLDTMWFTQCAVGVPSGATSAPVIWVQNTLSTLTEFPRWVECTHCGVEAPGQTGLRVDAGKNIEYSGYIAGTATGVAVGASAVEVNVHDTVFVWIGQSAITYAGTGGLQVHDNQFDGSGQQTNNSYDTISVANLAGNFQVVDNYWRNSTYFSSNLPRYGVNVGTGATDYVIARNRFQGATFGTAFLYDQTAAGHGGFFGSVINAGSAGITTGAASANGVFALEFTLPDQRLINKVVSEVTTASSGGHYSVGLYNQAGTAKLVDSGTISTTTAQVNSVTLSSPVALPPGVYWLAWCGDNSTYVLRAFTTGQSASINMMNKNAARQGSAGNSCTSGALPSTLGTITTTAASNAAAVWFEP